MKRLKNILQSKIFYCLLFIFIFFYCIFFTKIRDYTTSYPDDVKTITAKIINYKFDGSRLSLTLKDKETFVGNYYFKSEEELSFYKDKIKNGILVEISGAKKEVLENTIPNTFNYKKYLYYNHIYLNFYIEKIIILDEKLSIIDNIRNSINNRIKDKESSAYLKAFILGDKSLMDENSKNIISENGVSHLFALSGMHLSLVYIFLSKILKKVNKKNIIIFLVLFFYLIISGFSISFLRAIIFTLLIDINKHFNFGVSRFKILFITAFIILLIDPFDLYNVGFIYTFIITFSILLVSGKLTNKNKFYQTFMISLITFLFSMPITIYLNFEINLFSIVVNIILVPFVSALVFPMALITFFIPFLTPIFDILILCLNFMNLFLNAFKIMIIFGSINIFEIVVYYSILILLILSEKKLLIILLLGHLCAIYNKNLFDNNYYVYTLDVGQGSSNLLISPKNKEVIMIDTGGKIDFNKEEWKKSKNNNTVIKNIILFLKSIRIRKINYLIFTHGDADHMGYASFLLDNFKVTSCLINEGNTNNYERDVVKKCNINKSYQANYFDFEFIKTTSYDNENDNSIITLFNIQNNKFLFMGDASTLVEKNIMAKYKLKADFIVLGHHGSKTSSKKEFLKFISPKYGIISAGRNNLYHHPNEEVLKSLNELNIKSLNTQDMGTIKFEINKNLCNINGTFT